MRFKCTNCKSKEIRIVLDRNNEVLGECRGCGRKRHIPKNLVNTNKLDKLTHSTYKKSLFQKELNIN